MVLDPPAQTPDRTRDELAVAVRAEGLELGGQVMMLLLGLLELERLVCSGRRRDASHT